MFMRPEIRSGSYLLSLGIAPEDMGIAPVRGKWYGRLSAPGYTDSTEWCEYDSAEEALKGLCETFGLCSVCLKEEEYGCNCEQAERETDDD